VYLEEVYGKVPPPTTETTSALGKKDETGVSVLKTISPTGKAVPFFVNDMIIIFVLTFDTKLFILIFYTFDFFTLRIS